MNHGMFHFFFETQGHDNLVFGMLVWGNQCVRLSNQCRYCILHPAPRWSNNLGLKMNDLDSWWNFVLVPSCHMSGAQFLMMNKVGPLLAIKGVITSATHFFSAIYRGPVAPFKTIGSGPTLKAYWDTSELGRECEDKFICISIFSGWWQLKHLLFSPRSLGKWFNSTNIFQMGWIHQSVFWHKRNVRKTFLELDSLTVSVEWHTCRDD